MRVRHAVVLAALLFVGFGCGAQTPAGVVETGSKVSRNGCTVDPKQVCQICLRMFDQREVALRDNVGETKPDTHSLDQSERHLTILTDYRTRTENRSRSFSVGSICGRMQSRGQISPTE